jgi:hypothetical protein
MVKYIELLVGAVLIASGGVAFLPTTLPGAVLVADSFNVKW